MKFVEFIELINGFNKRVSIVPEHVSHVREEEIAGDKVTIIYVSGRACIITRETYNDVINKLILNQEEKEIEQPEQQEEVDYDTREHQSTCVNRAERESHKGVYKRR